MVKKDTQPTDQTSAVAKTPKATPTPTPAPQITTEASSSIPVIALVLGVVSLAMFVWPLGIPAIILGIIGLKKYKDNRGLSITGIVTGAISTLLMIISLIFFLFFIIGAVIQYNELQQDLFSPRDTTEPRSIDRDDWPRPSFEVM